MNLLTPILLFTLACGCKEAKPNLNRREDETKHWESVIRTTKSAEDLFEASFHLPYYFPEEFRRIGEEESYQFLITKLKSTDPKVRDNAASCLRWFPYGDRDSQLIEAYKRETEQDVKLGLLFAMANTNGSPEVFQFLSEILDGDNHSVRWSAARSLSVMGLPQTDELLARFQRDADARVREEVALHVKAKEREIIITQAEATQVLDIAKDLMISDKLNRTIQLSLIPAEIGNRKALEAKVYQEVLLIKLFEPDGGLIVNPLKENISPAMNNFWVTPTAFKGILKYEPML